MFHRLGGLKPVEQAGFGKRPAWGHQAPVNKGIWAFPWPFYDAFFTHHKIGAVLPKRFRTNDNGFPMSDEWYDVDPGEKIVWRKETFGEKESFYPYNSVTGEALYAADRYWEEQEKWCKQNLSKVLPIKKFWFKGDLYCKLDKHGRYLGEDWVCVDAVEYAKRVKRSGGDQTFYRPPGSDKVGIWRQSIDHLEVFIPAHTGKIS